MDVQTEEIADGVEAVVVTGAADISAAPALKEQLLGLVDRTDGDLVVDLGGCSFVDSAIVAVLISAVHQLGSRRLLAVCQPGGVLRVLTLTGADRAVTVVDTRAEAIRLLQTP
jgi:anti-sigma B factor antagonist